MAQPKVSGRAERELADLSIEAWADMRFEEWARAVRGAITAGLGYPRMSVEHRAIFGRGGGASGALPARVIEVETIICEMDERMRMAVMFKFERRAPDRQAARWLDCSRPAYNQLLVAARYYLAGCLR